MQEFNNDYLSEDLKERFGKLETILTLMEKDNDFDANRQIKFNNLSDCLLVRSTVQRYLKSTYGTSAIVDYTQPEHESLLAKVHCLLTSETCFDQDGLLSTLSADDKLHYAELLDTLFTSQNRMIKMGNTFWACLGTVGSVGNVVCSFSGLKYTGATSKAGSLLAKFIGNREFITITTEEMECLYDKNVAFDLAHLENLSTDAYRYVIENYIQSLKNDLDQCESTTEINVKITLMQESILKLQQDVDLNLQKSQSCYVTSEDQKKKKIFKFRRDIFLAAVKTGEFVFDLYEHQQQQKILKAQQSISFRKLEDQLHRARVSLDIVDPAQYLKDPMSYAIHVGQSMHYGLEEQFIDSKNRLTFLHDKLDMLKKHAEEREEFGEELDEKHQDVARHQDELIERIKNFHTTHLFNLAHNVLHLTGDINMVCAQGASVTPVGLTLYASAICCKFADKAIMYKQERKRLNLEEYLEIYNATAHSYQNLIQHNASNKQFLQSQLQQVSSSILQEPAITPQKRIQQLRTALEGCEKDHTTLLKQEAKANQKIQDLENLKTKRRYDEGRYFLAGKDGKADICKAEIIKAQSGIDEQRGNLLNIAQSLTFLQNGEDQCKLGLQQQVAFAPYQTVYNDFATPGITMCDESKDDEEYIKQMGSRSTDISKWLKDPDNVGKLRGELTREIEGYVYIQQASIKLAYRTAAGFESVAMPVIDILKDSDYFSMTPESAKKYKESIQWATRSGPKMYECISHYRTISLTTQLMRQAFRDQGTLAGMWSQVGTLNIVAGVINPGFILLGFGLSLYTAYNAKQEKNLQVKLYESILDTMFEYTKQIMNTMNSHFNHLKRGQDAIKELLQRQGHYLFSLQLQNATEVQQTILKQFSKSKNRLGKAVQHQQERNTDNVNKNTLSRALAQLKELSKLEKASDDAIERELINLKISGKQLFGTMFERAEKQPGEHIRDRYTLALPMSSHTEQELETFRGKLQVIMGDTTPPSLQAPFPSLFLQKTMTSQFNLVISKLVKHSTEASARILQSPALHKPIARTIKVTFSVVNGLEQFLDKTFFVLAALKIIHGLHLSYEKLFSQLDQQKNEIDEKYKHMGVEMDKENSPFFDHLRSHGLTEKSWYEKLIEDDKQLWVGERKFRANNLLTQKTLFVRKIRTTDEPYLYFFTEQKESTLIRNRVTIKEMGTKTVFDIPAANEKYTVGDSIGPWKKLNKPACRKYHPPRHPGCHHRRERITKMISLSSPKGMKYFGKPGVNNIIYSSISIYTSSANVPFISLHVDYGQPANITIDGTQISEEILKKVHQPKNTISYHLNSQYHTNLGNALKQYIADLKNICTESLQKIVEEFKITPQTFTNASLVLPIEKGYLPLLLPEKARLLILNSIMNKFKISSESSFRLYNNLWFQYGFKYDEGSSSYELWLDAYQKDKMIFRFPLANFDAFTVDSYRTYTEKWSFKEHELSPYMEFLFVAWYGLINKKTPAYSIKRFIDPTEKQIKHALKITKRSKEGYKFFVYSDKNTPWSAYYCPYQGDAVKNRPYAALDISLLLHKDIDGPHAHKKYKKEGEQFERDFEENLFKIFPTHPVFYPGLACHQSVQLTDRVYCPEEIPFVGLCNLLSSDHSYLSSGFYFMFNHEQYDWELADEYFRFINSEKDASFELSDIAKQQLLPYVQTQVTPYFRELLSKAKAYDNFICRLAFSQFNTQQFNQAFEYYDMLVTLLKLFSASSKENSQMALGSFLGVSSPEHLYTMIEDDKANTIMLWIKSQIKELSSINKNDFNSLLFFRNPDNTLLKEQRSLLQKLTHPASSNGKGKEEESEALGL